ncbi:MAG: glycosyltransferase [Oscillospiraceae bacterium]|nr:glycosyltransferase [Oscillospiraceae bacterium]
MSSEKAPDARQILELIETVLDAIEQMHLACVDVNDELFNSLSADVMSACQSLMYYTQDISKTESLFLASESILYSLERIILSYKSGNSNCSHKIEFELYPLTQTFYMNFYFFEIASLDDELQKQYKEHDRFLLGGNAYIDKAEETGDYKYELSIIVLGYNKLEYTMLCVKSLLKYIPSDLNYELILLNHGSSDGTKEFFEETAPNKQLDILRNGGGIGCVERIIEGKYCLAISNDVLVTESAIENMLACVKSDKDIAYVVPATSSVSNLQTIAEKFDGIDEMYAFASKNNIQNPLKWEQRNRLINPISMYPAKYLISSNGILASTYMLSNNSYLFPDDLTSHLIRKQGKKLILAKDAYCFHFGSVTLGDENTTKFFKNGRNNYLNEFGYDPWGKGACYDLDFFKSLNLQQHNNAKILGVSSGLGANPLKIKTALRELGSNDIKLFLTSDDEQFKIDYETFTDPCYVNITEASKFSSAFKDEMFDYILVETDIEPSEVSIYFKRLLKNGRLCILNKKSENDIFLKNNKPINTIKTKHGIWYCYIAS